MQLLGYMIIACLIDTLPNSFPECLYHTTFPPSMCQWSSISKSSPLFSASIVLLWPYMQMTLSFESVSANGFFVMGVIFLLIWCFFKKIRFSFVVIFTLLNAELCCVPLNVSRHVAGLLEISWMVMRLAFKLPLDGSRTTFSLRLIEAHCPLDIFVNKFLVLMRPFCTGWWQHKLFLVLSSSKKCLTLTELQEVLSLAESNNWYVIFILLFST